MQVGDTVRINQPTHPAHGKSGIVAGSMAWEGHPDDYTVWYQPAVQTVDDDGNPVTYDRGIHAAAQLTLVTPATVAAS